MRIDGGYLHLDAKQLVDSFSLRPSVACLRSHVFSGQEKIGRFLDGWEPGAKELNRRIADIGSEISANACAAINAWRELAPEEEARRELVRHSSAFLDLDPANVDLRLQIARAFLENNEPSHSASLIAKLEAEAHDLSESQRVAVKTLRRDIRRAVGARDSTRSQFIGRQEVLSVVSGTNARGVSPDASAVWIVGPSQSGKTRVLREALRLSRLRGHSAVYISHTAAARGAPLRLVRALLDAITQLPGAAGVSERANEALNVLADDWSPQSSLAWTSGPPRRTSGASLVSALAEVLEAATEESPLLIAIDDFGQADRVSQHLVLSVLRSLPPSPARLLVALDDADWPSLSKSFSPRELEAVQRLDELSEAESASLVASVIHMSGAEASEPRVKSVVRSVHRRLPGVLIAAAQQDVESTKQPTHHESLQKAIWQRLATVHGRAAHVLLCLSHLGGTAKVELLAGVLEASSIEILDSIDQLNEADLVSFEDDHVVCGNLTAELAQAWFPGAIVSFTRSRVLQTLRGRLHSSFSSELCEATLALALTSRDASEHAALALEFAGTLAGDGNFRTANEHLEQAILRHSASDERQLSLIREQQMLARRACAFHYLEKSSARAAQIFRKESTTEFVSARVGEIEGILSQNSADRVHDLFAELLDYANDTSLSAERRCDAVRVCISAAADFFETEAALAAFEVLSTLDDLSEAPMSDYGRVSMQFHAIFGQLEEATKIARSGLTEFSRDPRDSSKLRAATNCAHVLRLCGQCEESESAFRFLIETEAVRSSPGSRFYSLWQLSLIGLDIGDLSSAVAWYDRMLEFLSREPTRIDRDIAPLHGERIALQLSAQPSGMGAARGILGAFRNRSRRLAMYAAGLVLVNDSLDEEVPVDEALLRSLVTHLERNARFPVQDVMFAGAVAGLKRSDASADALDLLSREKDLRRSVGRISTPAIISMVTTEL